MLLSLSLSLSLLLVITCHAYATSLSCPTDMALIVTATGPMCVDRYEAMLIVTDTGKVWPFNHPVDSLPDGSYYAVPARDALPQAYISADQVCL